VPHPKELEQFVPLHVLELGLLVDHLVGPDILRDEGLVHHSERIGQPLLRDHIQEQDAHPPHVNLVADRQHVHVPDVDLNLLDEIRPETLVLEDECFRRGLQHLVVEWDALL